MITLSENSGSINLKKNGKRLKRSKQYFTVETEDAIVQYNNEENFIIRNRIYEEKIHYPFTKIAENLINKYNFPYIQSEDLQQDVVTYMIQKMHRYEKDKGKAFSYFSVMARNFLIAGNREAYAKLKSHYKIDDPDLQHTDLLSEDDHVVNTDILEFYAILLRFWDDNIEHVFKKDRDRKIANAILSLLERSHYIENYNKKYLYLLIKEQTDIRPQYITNVINKMSTITDLLKRMYVAGVEIKLDNLEL